MSKPTHDRQYLGVTITASNYREILDKEGRDGINFHTKHLKAYLQGKSEFNHRWARDKKGKVIKDSFAFPMWNKFKVQQKIDLVTS